MIMIFKSLDKIALILCLLMGRKNIIIYSKLSYYFVLREDSFYSPFCPIIVYLRKFINILLHINESISIYTFILIKISYYNYYYNEFLDYYFKKTFIRFKYNLFF